MTVRLDRLERALFTMFSGIADNVHWAHNEPSREQLGGAFFKLQLIAGPTDWQPLQTGVLLRPADSVVVRVTGATSGTRNVIRLNDFDHYRDTVGGDTKTTIRDALLAMITTTEQPGITATASSTDSILLEGDSLGDLRRLTLSGQLDDDSSAVFSGDAVIETEGTCVCVVSVQAFSQTKTLSGGAASLIAQARAATRSPSKLEQLHREGVAIWDRGEVVYLDGTAGAHWETRASFDLELAAHAVDVESVEQIEDITLTTTIGSATVEATVSAP